MSDFRCLWGSLLGPPKGLKSILKLNLNSSSASERHFGYLGAVLGSMLGSFWGRLGFCFAVRRPNTKTLIFDDPLTRKRVFSGLWGSQKQPKISPESFLAPNLAPKASWRPLGFDFWTLWGSQNGPPRGQESKLKFEAFWMRFLKQGSQGPAARGLPQWEGTFGESTYGRRWASPKLCLSQCFRNPQVASLTASSEPEGSVAGSPVGLRPQTGH